MPRKSPPPPDPSRVVKPRATAKFREALIAEAAYFRAQYRGFEPGHEVEDWLSAETEIDKKLKGARRSRRAPS